jgi:CHAT domain-containing protein
MADSGSAADLGETQARVREILAWLWDNAAEPVLHALGHHRPPAPGRPWPRVWWAPGGLLGLLPIHAAGHHTRPFDPAHRTVMDRVVSSYTPTVGALAHARRRVAAPSAGMNRSLVVAMPTTPGEDGLPGARTEVATVAARLPCPVVLIESAGDPRRIPTKANVLAHLDGCAIAHFTCHGHTDVIDPSQSGLLLHDHQDEPLTIAALASVALDHARLAYLSACGTALTSTAALLDEAIHLTSAFQLAGFPSVIGTLWEINDHVAARIADGFYAALTADGGVPGTGRAAHALHHAVHAARRRYPTAPSLWGAYLHAGA